MGRTLCQSVTNDDVQLGEAQGTTSDYTNVVIVCKWKNALNTLKLHTAEFLIKENPFSISGNVGFRSSGRLYNARLSQGNKDVANIKKKKYVDVSFLDGRYELVAVLRGSTKPQRLLERPRF